MTNQRKKKRSSFTQSSRGEIKYKQTHTHKKKKSDKADSSLTLFFFSFSRVKEMRRGVLLSCASWYRWKGDAKRDISKRTWKSKKEKKKSGRRLHRHASK